AKNHSSRSRTVVCDLRVLLSLAEWLSRAVFISGKFRAFIVKATGLSGGYLSVCHQPVQKKRMLLFGPQSFRPQSCCCRERDHGGLLSCCPREGDALRLCNAMLPSQVAVSFHCQRATVLVPEPAGNSRNVNAGFDTPRCEQVPQIVMSDAIYADL